MNSAIKAVADERLSRTSRVVRTMLATWARHNMRVHIGDKNQTNNPSGMTQNSKSLEIAEETIMN